MGVENFRHTTQAPELPEPYAAYWQLQNLQTQVLSSAEDFGQKPSSSSGEKLNAAMGASCRMFEQFAASVVADEVMSDEAKSELLAHAIKRADNERVERFMKILPTGTFKVINHTQEEMAEKYFEILSAYSTDKDEFTGQLSYNYINGLGTDCVDLINQVHALRAEKSKSTYKSMLQAAAGVAVTGLVTYGVLRKSASSPKNR